MPKPEQGQGTVPLHLQKKMGIKSGKWENLGKSRKKLSQNLEKEEKVRKGKGNHEENPEIKVGLLHDALNCRKVAISYLGLG